MITCSVTCTCEAGRGVNSPMLKRLMTISASRKTITRFLGSFSPSIAWIKPNTKSCERLCDISERRESDNCGKRCNFNNATMFEAWERKKHSEQNELTAKLHSTNSVLLGARKNSPSQNLASRLPKMDNTVWRSNWFRACVWMSEKIERQIAAASS